MQVPADLLWPFAGLPMLHAADACVEHSLPHPGLQTVPLQQ